MRNIVNLTQAEPEESSVDITPMLDVVFIMLIFFIVTATFIKEAGIDVDKPAAATAVVQEKASILIAIDAQDKVWINRRQVDIRSVRSIVERLHAENPKGTVVIQADRESRNNTLVQVMDASRRAGVYDIALGGNNGLNLVLSITSKPHTNSLALGFALSFGVLCALALAWFMIKLIENSELQLSESGRAQMLDFVRVKRAETTSRKDRKPERPQVTRTPEAPPADNTDSSASDAQLSVNVGDFSALQSNLNVDSGSGISSGDGEYLPIVKVAPIYPRSALSRKITGECLVTYTVTRNGTIKGRDCC